MLITLGTSNAKKMDVNPIYTGVFRVKQNIALFPAHRVTKNNLTRAAAKIFSFAIVIEIVAYLHHLIRSNKENI